MNTTEKLKATTEAWGADFFGVADLAPAHDAIVEQGGAVLAGYPRAVSVGIALPNAIVDQLPQRANRAIAINYRQHGYEVVSLRLDQLTSQLSSLLQREGFQAWPVPAAKRVDDERICAIFSH
jgi:epoxyqueuosine reductase